MMETCELRYRNSVIRYYRFGSGTKPVVCFHGYGEQAASYAFLEEAAGKQFMFYAIDLPFHGNTQWNEGLDFSSDDLRQVIIMMLSAHNYKPQTANYKLTLIGFSLGGRMALDFYQHNPGIVEKIILLAPDGLKVNSWYWLATQTWAGNRFFAFTMKKPGWFFGFLKLINKLGWVNASIFKFVNFYIGNPEARKLLYNRWTALRKIKPNLAEIKRSAREQNTQVRLLYGKHDRIILSSVGEKFRKGIEAYSSLRVIHSGHQLLHEKHAAEILPALLH